MTIWHWVRHGPTHQKTFVGWRDVPADLSDTATLDRLRRHLPQKATLVSSDLKRCVATADALRGPGHTYLPPIKDLREINFGVWDGMHHRDISKRDPKLSRAFWETPGDIAAPEGESWNETAGRVSAVVDGLNAAHPDVEIIAVAHFGVILTQLQRALAVTAYDVMAHKIDNLSVTTLVYDHGSWKAEQINHLP
ncbi:MAG: histidine phosphatase family protein [Pseudomonadota bacterium]